MQIEITLAGGKRVDAKIGDFEVRTDQPVAQGGTGTTVGPFDLFLAAVGTCAGIFIVNFCQARGIATDGIGLVQHVENDPVTKLPKHIRLELRLPADFPDEYRAAVVRAADACKVKKMLAAPPTITVETNAESDGVPCSGERLRPGSRADAPIAKSS